MGRRCGRRFSELRLTGDVKSVSRRPTPKSLPYTIRSYSIAVPSSKQQNSTRSTPTYTYPTRQLKQPTDRVPPISRTWRSGNYKSPPYVFAVAVVLSRSTPTLCHFDRSEAKWRTPRIGSPQHHHKSVILSEGSRGFMREPQSKDLPPCPPTHTARTFQPQSYRRQAKLDPNQIPLA